VPVPVVPVAVVPVPDPAAALVAGVLAVPVVSGSPAGIFVSTVFVATDLHPHLGQLRGVTFHGE